MEKKENTIITVSAKVSAEEKEQLVKYCKANDETISRVVRKALREFLDTHDQTN